MNSASAGAVFFLGNRAHYQVLEQPGFRSGDLENGNTSTETIPEIYEKSPKYWEIECSDKKAGNPGHCDNGNKDYYGFYDLKDKHPISSSNRAMMYQREDLSPAQLNKIDNIPLPQTKTSKSSILSYLASLLKPKKRPEYNLQYLQQLEKILTTCTYRDSCRCFECQSRYFECDESDDCDSDNDEFIARYIDQLLKAQTHTQKAVKQDDDDEEVFVDRLPEEKKTTDCPVDKRTNMAADEVVDGQDNTLQLEVAAGTPVFLNYLLTHPVTCCIQ